MARHMSEHKHRELMEASEPKTRVVLMLDILEFARLAGAASGAKLTVQEFIKRELKLDRTLQDPIEEE